MYYSSQYVIGMHLISYRNQYRKSRLLGYDRDAIIFRDLRNICHIDCCNNKYSISDLYHKNT